MTKQRTRNPESSNLTSLIKKLHLHPKLVHFPIAYSVLVTLFAALYIFLKEPQLETASFYVLVFVFLSTPVSALTGYASWKINYKGASTRLFTKKKILSLILSLNSTLCLIWRILVPDILISFRIQSYFYLVLLFILTPSVILLGHEGGKLVSPPRTRK